MWTHAEPQTCAVNFLITRVCQGARARWKTQEDSRGNKTAREGETERDMQS